MVEEERKASEIGDNIHNPSRYCKGEIQCWQAIESATCNLTGIEAFDTGNVIKYMWRWKDKEPIDSLKKAKEYIDHIIQHLEADHDRS